MDRSLANDIIAVTDPHSLDIWKRVWDQLIEKEISKLKMARDFDTVLKAQGAINSLESLKNIRSVAEGVLMHG